MTLKIAMIATGGIADTQLAPALALAPSAQLWSVYSRDKARADAFVRAVECLVHVRRLAVAPSARRIQWRDLSACGARRPRPRTAAR